MARLPLRRRQGEQEHGPFVRVLEGVRVLGLESLAGFVCRQAVADEIAEVLPHVGRQVVGEDRGTPRTHSLKPTMTRP